MLLLEIGLALYASSEENSCDIKKEREGQENTRFFLLVPFFGASKRKIVGNGSHCLSLSRVLFLLVSAINAKPIIVDTQCSDKWSKNNSASLPRNLLSERKAFYLELLGDSTLKYQTNVFAQNLFLDFHASCLKF